MNELQEGMILVTNPTRVNAEIEEYAGLQQTFPVMSISYYPSLESPVLKNPQYWEYFQRRGVYEPGLDVQNPRDVRLDVSGNFYVTTPRTGALYEAKLLISERSDGQNTSRYKDHEDDLDLMTALLPKGFGGKHMVWDFKKAPAGLVWLASFYTYDEHISRWSIDIGRTNKEEAKTNS